VRGRLALPVLVLVTSSMLTGTIKPPEVPMTEGTAATSLVSGEASPTYTPVLFVPGWLDTARDLAAMRVHLLGAEWPTIHVEAVTFLDPTGSNREHALCCPIHAVLLRDQRVFLEKGGGKS
jgi:hypothetical protein